MEADQLHGLFKYPYFTGHQTDEQTEIIRSIPEREQTNSIET